MYLFRKRLRTSQKTTKYSTMIKYVLRYFFQLYCYFLSVLQNTSNARPFLGIKNLFINLQIRRNMYLYYFLQQELDKQNEIVDNDFYVDFTGKIFFFKNKSVHNTAPMVKKKPDTVALTRCKLHRLTLFLFSNISYRKFQSFFYHRINP